VKDIDGKLDMYLFYCKYIVTFYIILPLFCVNSYHACTVTPAVLEEFNERGYWVGPKILDDESIQVLRDAFDRVFNGEVDYPCSPYEYSYWRKIVAMHRADSPEVRKLNNAWNISAALRKLFESEVIGKAASKLLGTSEVRLWHDQAIWKPSSATADGKEGNIGWHQDYGYWQISNTSNMCTAWIPLQDVDLTNGGMRTIVGSHKWGLVPDSTTFFDKNMDNLQKKFAQSAPSEWIDEPCIMKAGQIAFHHALTFHGSGPNTSGKPRLALAVHIQPQDCGFAPGHGWHHNLKDLGPYAKAGDLFAGDNFPVLYRAP